jgi:hypothetical protein
MTAGTAPATHPRARRVPLASPARLLLLELRRSPMLGMLPLLAILFWVSTYRPSMSNPPFWNVRSGILQSHTLLPFAPLLAGTAAWAGARDGRRGITDLVNATAIPRWAGQLVLWASATCWAMVAYLAGVAVLYGVTAHEGARGGPLWWPAAVGAATVAASCALGFAAGATFPGWFTAPLAAVVMFLALAGGAFAAQANATYAQIWPLNVQGPFPVDSYGIFYPYLPDLPIAQVMFLAGLAAAALGTLGLPRAVGGPLLRGAAAVLTVAGLAAAGTAVGLAGTARVEPHGIVIPALHDAASDRPLPYSPVCSHSAVPVCVHPAYRPFLPAVTTALRPVLDEVAGLPGAPVRVTQVAVTTVRQGHGNSVEFGLPAISGSPPVLLLPLTGLSLPGEGNTPVARFTRQLQAQGAPSILNALVGLPNHEGLYGGGGPGQTGLGVPRPARGTSAQLAVAAALAKVAGLLATASLGQPPPGNGPPPGGAMLAAIRRFAAMPAPARHAWLASHATALRGGRITLSEIP